MPKTNKLIGELDIRELKLLDGVARGMSGKDAAIRAGYSPGRAVQTASEKLANGSVRAALTRALEGQGYTLEKIASKMIELHQMDAHAVTKDGDVVTLGPDGATRAKAMDMSLKLLDAYPSARLDISAETVTTFVLRHEDSMAQAAVLADVIDVTPGAAQLPEQARDIPTQGIDEH